MALNEHRIPSVLKRDWAWFLFRKTKSILYRRNAVIASAVTSLKGDAVLDIGAGEGYWLRAIAKQMPCAASEPNPDLAQFVRDTCGVQVWDSLSKSPWQPFISAYSSPVVWLFSVLQYVPNPSQMLRELHEGSPAGTEIWMYQPIHQRQILGIYTRLFDRWPSYESVQGRQVVWAWSELQDLLEGCDWGIIEHHAAYGKWGILAHELWGIGVLAWGRRFWKPFSLLYMIAVLPLVWLFNQLDAKFPPSNLRQANGVWLKLAKKKA